MVAMENEKALKSHNLGVHSGPTMTLGNSCYLFKIHFPLWGGDKNIQSKKTKHRRMLLQYHKDYVF